MRTTRLTGAQALVTWLTAQRTELDGRDVPLFPGVFAIFGHGNVTCLGEALETHRDQLPTWRGQNEQTMAMAAVGFAKARRRRQVMVATSSIGPGALNMVTAAGIAMANRLPLLLISGDTFASRLPDPVLQQVEHFGNPTTTVNDAFRPVTRYWDRITRPEQLLQSLPQAAAMLLDPADCGPAFIGFAQDAQAEAYDFPTAFFEPRIWRIPRPAPDERQLQDAVAALRGAVRPLIVAGGGAHYSSAEQALADFAMAHDLPVVETMAGRSCLTWDHPNYAGPLGVTGSDAANALAAEADVVLAVGTRLQDFTTGSWTVFDERAQIIGCNAARFDAHKHGSLPLVADASIALAGLTRSLGNWRAQPAWLERAQGLMAGWNDQVVRATTPRERSLPSYAEVIGVLNRNGEDDDYVVAAAGGFPGELNVNWRSRSVGSFDCEYGFSCMGYEIAGAWGAKMALADREVIAFVGDGSWLMANSEVFSTVANEHKVIYVLCDNGGYAVIDRLQRGTGSDSFHNLLEDSNYAQPVRVDFVRHAQAMGAHAELVPSLAALPEALLRARQGERTAVLVVRTDPDAWSEGGAWWEVGVPEVSTKPGVREARAQHEDGKRRQRAGI